MISKSELSISIGKVEWTDDAWEITFNHPSIQMTPMTEKALSSGKLKTFDGWEPEHGYANLECVDDDIKVCITDGQIIMTGGFVSEGDDALDGTIIPDQLSLRDFLMVAKTARLILF